MMYYLAIFLHLRNDAILLYGCYCQIVIYKELYYDQWNNAFSLIIEGTTEKVLQFIMPLKSINNRNFGFIEQKINFEHCREFQARNTQLIDIIFAMKNNICCPF
jgi:hypothetical protein